MKIWHGYGTEHSMNLELIGHFLTASDALKAREAIAVLTGAAELDHADGRLEYGAPPELFSDRLLEAMSGTGVHSLGHADIEQLLYDAQVEARDSDVVVRTDEIEVLAYIKVLIAKGARVEIYSMHDQTDGASDE
ncbi:DUF6375 family protein [Microbacterium oleivorans]|uniref:DUF6375 family protein n=1 Tax=Microbacterium oleivorans TaxID=273677 RepID=UPI0007678886|nr:DUF6375 family protein [Microbacterium oleivorans]